MAVTGIHHSSVVVTDVNRARQFYREALGLQELPAPSTFDFVVAWFAVGAEQIHLLLKAQADTKSPRHVALHVEDLDAMRSHLQKLGAPIRDTDPIPGASRFFTADPDGNQIELIEWTTPWPQADPRAWIRP
ncbi:MAG TPA: VOC family protein [Armatimonadota bacterium]|nr:VOC family protein [Armatimonadota bacterium]